MNAVVYQEPYKLPAGILAIAVHGAFFALLYFGFTWQTLSPATMSVELWQNLPDRVDAPPVQPEIEEAVPPPQPEKVVEPEVAPPQPEKIVEPEIVLPDEKTETEPVEAKPDKKKKPAPVPEKKVKPKPARQEMEARIAEQAAREQAAQAARERIEQAERAARERAEQAERAARERTEQAARERAGQAEQAAAIGRVVDEYTGKIVSKIRRNIVMPPDVADDARAEFSVTLLPGGTVLGARLTRSSGNAAYDNAVERAILKSQPLPLPADMGLFSRFRELELVFKPIE